MLLGTRTTMTKPPALRGTAFILRPTMRGSSPSRAKFSNRCSSLSRSTPSKATSAVGIASSSSIPTIKWPPNVFAKDDTSFRKLTFVAVADPVRRPLVIVQLSFRRACIDEVDQITLCDFIEFQDRQRHPERPRRRCYRASSLAAHPISEQAAKSRLFCFPQPVHELRFLRARICSRPVG